MVSYPNPDRNALRRNTDALPNAQLVAIDFPVPLDRQQFVYTQTTGFSDRPAGVTLLDLNLLIAVCTLYLLTLIISACTTIYKLEHQKHEDNDKECEREHEADALFILFPDILVVRVDFLPETLGVLWRRWAGGRGASCGGGRGLIDGAEDAVAVARCRLVVLPCRGVEEGVRFRVGIVAYALEVLRKTLLILMALSV